jgi:hypothetical protein
VYSPFHPPERCSSGTRRGASHAREQLWHQIGRLAEHVPRNSGEDAGDACPQENTFGRHWPNWLLRS